MPTVADPSHADPVLDALDALVDALRKNIAVSSAAIERAEEVRRLRTSGMAYRQIADQTGRPFVVELVTENLMRLRAEGAALRRAQALALHDEGETMERIAAMFGVTRQRISAILREAGR